MRTFKSKKLEVLIEGPAAMLIHMQVFERRV